jgi:flagellar protein FlgJ
MSSVSSSAFSSPGLAVDPGALNALHHQAGRDGGRQPAAIREAARQFEALFMRELIKSMREATQKSGLLDGEGTDLGTELLDQQLAVQLAGMPGGLSAAIERQLSRQMSPGAATAVPARPAAASAHVDKAQDRQAAFVGRHAAAAAAVEREFGIPAGYMLGQAGHETGWGRSEIRHRDGSPSYNLFGIKATPAWKGRVAEVVTTEYVGGVPRKTVARFRAYDSYEAAFRDYARLITRSPRYAQVATQVGSVQGYAHGLQQAGYATDPHYATKVGRAIQTALNLQRTMA